ncbi:hypothetical protein L7F22_044619 [Adiantum nelumboides]|nr:hypothetical protein [Adiantum nelumboides]
MDPSGHSSISNPNASSKGKTIRWRKGELIGAGAFGSVYMGMNLDSGELLAVKQVLIAAKNVAKDKSQAHLRELEEEVKLLQNLSHPNIVRYLGTAREDDALNIFLEFVPGGSIASLLGKFGSFPEPVIRMYVRQLLRGLEYLHRNGIMHRDIKGANILVDNKGRIKLADFGASKQVVELVTISGARSMKGTPYWMAPEVIRQTGHSLPADIWSVGCTIIEMATGKAPWSQQFQEVAALFHIGTTKSHPPIPEHLSHEAQDFLLKCLRKEPYLRPTASELLLHPFVSTESTCRASGPILDTHATKTSQIFESCKKRPLNALEESCVKRSAAFCQNSLGNLNFSRFLTVDRVSWRDADSNCSVRFDCNSYMTKSFQSACDGSPLMGTAWGRQSRSNPMMNPLSCSPIHELPDVDDDWCNLASPELKENKRAENLHIATAHIQPFDENANFSFQCTPAHEDDDEDEVTEAKIKAFLDEKALELKKMQTPLYMEYQSVWNVGGRLVEKTNSFRNDWQPKGVSQSTIAALKSAAEPQLTSPRSSRSSSRKSSRSGLSIACSRESEATVSSESPRLNELKRLLQETQHPLRSPSTINSTERQRLWKQELQTELEIEREERKLQSQSVAGSSSSSSIRPSSACKLSSQASQAYCGKKMQRTLIPTPKKNSCLSDHVPLSAEPARGVDWQKPIQF